MMLFIKQKMINTRMAKFLAFLNQSAVLYIQIIKFHLCESV